MADKKWEIVPFAKPDHDRKDFSCGRDSLDNWLKKQASQFLKRDLARLFVLISEGSPKVCGFYTLSSHSIEYETLPEDLAKGLPPRMSIPVILIGKLAIDKNHQGQHLGELLLMDALRQVHKLSEKIGIRAVVLDAIDESAKSFYLKYGFCSLMDDENHLYLPIKTIRELGLN
ncbi:MAG: GNAT family N-acetyltransferase [Planctomycetaceae bacterium]|nr:GNAT family N-acetyltransferase [Planctomycetaceae bacterium]